MLFPSSFNSACSRLASARLAASSDCFGSGSEVFFGTGSDVFFGSGSEVFFESGPEVDVDPAPPPFAWSVPDCFEPGSEVVVFSWVDDTTINITNNGAIIIIHVPPGADLIV